MIHTYPELLKIREWKITLAILLQLYRYKKAPLTARDSIIMQGVFPCLYCTGASSKNKGLRLAWDGAGQPGPGGWIGHKGKSTNLRRNGKNQPRHVHAPSKPNVGQPRAPACVSKDRTISHRCTPFKILNHLPIKSIYYYYNYYYIILCVNNAHYMAFVITGILCWLFLAFANFKNFLWVPISTYTKVLFSICSKYRRANICHIYSQSHARRAEN